MRLFYTFIILIFLSLNSVSAQELNEKISNEDPEKAIFLELGGKGFLSLNGDFPLSGKHRASIGVTFLDYETEGASPEKVNINTWPSPGIMYYYLAGKKRSKFELGAGISTSPFPWKTYHNENFSDHPLSLHAVIGYRYQKRNGFMFRAGIYPFYRPRVWVLPLPGISLGYSW